MGGLGALMTDLGESNFKRRHTTWRYAYYPHQLGIVHVAAERPFDRFK